LIRQICLIGPVHQVSHDQITDKRGKGVSGDKFDDRFGNIRTGDSWHFKIFSFLINCVKVNTNSRNFLNLVHSFLTNRLSKDLIYRHLFSI